ncbi:hypothetical protein JTE90_000566 [Oedothorax gibbosus]|uniref:Uncharacterized protein n=1 Tax=Oedothorax gibbosus TaxID=931172 RepID=A0AAV6VY51_9ARAC|nr:hypothetical protein JTE90_000566 [Oedothorax gibbosus]
MAEEGGTSKFEVTQAKTPDDSTLSPMSPTSYSISDNDRTTDRLLPGGDGNPSDDHANKEAGTFDKNLYLYSDEMAERPQVASLLSTLANYDVAIPTVEEEGKEGKAAPKVCTTYTHYTSDRQK